MSTKLVLTHQTGNSVSKLIDFLVNPKTEAERLAMTITGDMAGLQVFQKDGTSPGLYIVNANAQWDFIGPATSAIANVLAQAKAYTDSSITTLDTDLRDKINTDIQNLETTLTDALNQGDADTLQSAKDYADTLNTSMTQALNSLQAALNNEITARNNGDTQNANAIVTLQGQVNTLSTFVDAIDARVTTLETDMTDAQARIAALEDGDGVAVAGASLVAGTPYVVTLPKAMKSKNHFTNPNVVDSATGEGIEVQYKAISDTEIQILVNQDVTADIYIEVDFATTPVVLYNFDVTADWATMMVTDQASFFDFITLLNSYPGTTVTDFVKNGNNIKCNINGGYELSIPTVTDIVAIPNTITNLNVKFSTLTSSILDYCASVVLSSNVLKNWDSSNITPIASPSSSNKSQIGALCVANGGVAIFQ